MSFSQAIHNGQVIDIAAAQLPVTDIAFSYGFGVYESIRVKESVAYYAEQHAERLLRSAAHIGLEHSYSAADIQQQIQLLIETVGDAAEAYNIKILLIGGADPQLYLLPSAPLFPDRKLFKEGATLVSTVYERPFPEAKTLAMIGSYIAYSKAKEVGAYDALTLDREGHAIEGTRTNFFVVKKNTIYRAPQEMILEGVTKMIVEQQARAAGYKIVEKLIPLEDLDQYDGAFITSTSSKVMPVRAIDDMTFNIPDSIRDLQQRFDEFQKESSGVIPPHFFSSSTD